MENNKKTMVLLATIIVLLLIIIAFMSLRGLSRNNPLNEVDNPVSQEKIPGNSPSVKSPESVTVTDKTKIPETVTGTIAKIDGDKITIRQFASYNLNYVVDKSDLSKIVILKQNPSFDQAKAEAAIKKAQEEIRAGRNSNTNNTINPEVPIDPSLQPYLEENIDLNNIVIGSQTNLQTDGKGAKKLIIYPKEINIAPPAQE